MMTVMIFFVLFTNSFDFTQTYIMIIAYCIKTLRSNRCSAMKTAKTKCTKDWRRHFIIESRSSFISIPLCEARAQRWLLFLL